VASLQESDANVRRAPCVQLLCVQGVDIGRSDFLPGLPRVVSVSLLLRFLASHDTRSCCRCRSSSSLLIDVQLCVLFLRSLKRQGRRSEMEEGTSLTAVFEQTRSYCLFPSLRMQERRSEMREGTIARRDRSV